VIIVEGFSSPSISHYQLSAPKTVLGSPLQNTKLGKASEPNSPHNQEADVGYFFLQSHIKG
jgi:hypothetical protein